VAEKEGLTALIPHILPESKRKSMPRCGIFYVLHLRLLKAELSMLGIKHKRLSYCSTLLRTSAEKEGFEPPDLLQSTVFKTAALDRSAISPGAKLPFFLVLQVTFQKNIS
jgi:hypothetical protein